MRPGHFSAIAVLVLTASVTLPSVLEAQRLRDRVRDRTRQQVERRAEERAADAVDRALDATEQGIRCVFTDAECIGRARAEGHDVIYVDAQGNRTDEAGNPAPEPAQGPAAFRLDDPVWVNFDFVAGDRVLFYDDYSADRVGNFPRRLEFGSGNMEVADWRDRRFMRATSPGFFRVPLPETLPERFTIEFEVRQWHGSHEVVLVTAAIAPPHLLGAHEGSAIVADRHGAGLRAYRAGGEAVTRGVIGFEEAVPTVRVMGDGSYVKVYLDETRVANVPNAVLERTGALTFLIRWADDEHPVLIGPIRVAAGGAPIYDALMEDGRVVTRGILFATGAAEIRPESRGALREIGEMLQRHPTLRLRIEGHTDSIGTPDLNQVLSERRAAAVREFLLRSYGIEADRLEAVGLGQTQPIDSNDTPEGRQNNRRVELVRL